jgi:hypothetical protein
MKKIRGDKPMEISQGNSLCSYLYLKLKCHLFSFYLFSFSFYKIREHEGRASLAWGKAGTNRRG